jgi:hypothetical protein
MVPAKQRFESNDLGRRNPDLGLVEQLELVIQKGHPKLLRKASAAAHCHFHFRFEKASAASTRVLGAIKRHVGIGEKLLRHVAIIGIERNADTCSDVREVAVDIERSLEGIHKPSRQRRRGRGLVALALHDHEFISSYASEKIAAP